jgi:hypothetical protein
MFKTVQTEFKSLVEWDFQKILQWNLCLNARIAQFMKVQMKLTEISVGMLIKKCERSC